jgi:hypothetical protein
MGVDFIEKVGRTFVKHLDSARSRLSTADLFTRTPVEDRPTYPVRTKPDAKLKVGQELIVEVSGNSLVYSDALTVVARDDNPPADIYRAVVESHGTATATVKDLLEISSVAEVSLC